MENSSVLPLRPVQFFKAEIDQNCPRFIEFDDTLSLRQKETYAAIYKICRYTGETIRTQEDLIKDLGICRRTFQNHLTVLSKKGLVSCRRTSSGKNLTKILLNDYVQALIRKAKLKTNPAYAGILREEAERDINRVYEEYNENLAYFEALRPKARAKKSLSQQDPSITAQNPPTEAPVSASPILRDSGAGASCAYESEPEYASYELDDQAFFEAAYDECSETYEELEAFAQSGQNATSSLRIEKPESALPTLYGKREKKEEIPSIPPDFETPAQMATGTGPMDVAYGGGSSAPLSVSRVERYGSLKGRRIFKLSFEDCDGNPVTFLARKIRERSLHRHFHNCVKVRYRDAHGNFKTAFFDISINAEIPEALAHAIQQNGRMVISAPQENPSKHTAGVLEGNRTGNDVTPEEKAGEAAALNALPTSQGYGREARLSFSETGRAVVTFEAPGRINAPCMAEAPGQTPENGWKAGRRFSVGHATQNAFAPYVPQQNVPNELPPEIENYVPQNINRRMLKAIHERIRSPKLRKRFIYIYDIYPNKTSVYADIKEWMWGENNNTNIEDDFLHMSIEWNMNHNKVWRYVDGQRCYVPKFYTFLQEGQYLNCEDTRENTEKMNEIVMRKTPEQTRAISELQAGNDRLCELFPNMDKASLRLNIFTLHRKSNVSINKILQISANIKHNGAVQEEFIPFMIRQIEQVASA
ncbi:MAG: hypothetical protein IKO41_16080 [Lachnospiraceae bacterium]|nr:hypothetical protein [Lachnospiraceae bacterium]